MDFLKKAELAVYTVADKTSPVATRRMRLAQKVEEQIKVVSRMWWKFSGGDPRAL